MLFLPEEVGDVPRPDDEASSVAECQALADRIAAARRVHEHHLWEALRILPSLAAAREDPDFRRSFRALMEREALDAAGRVLIAAADPERRFDRLHFVNGMWVVGLSSPESGSRRTYGRHNDLLAAMIEALARADSLHSRHRITPQSDARNAPEGVPLESSSSSGRLTSQGK